MPDTPNGAQAQREQDASADRAQMHLADTHDSAELTVFETAAWIPPAYRQAYLEGAASVLGYEPLIES
jgi:hypothetical protein